MSKKLPKAIILVARYPTSVVNQILKKIEMDKLINYVVITPEKFNPVPFQKMDAEILAVFCAQRPEFEKVLLKNKSIQWCHSLISGIDRIMGEGQSGFKGPTTNARGAASDGLAEFVSFGMQWHAKNAEKWHEQKTNRIWQPCAVNMLSEMTLGIVGYGAIGQEIAKIVKYGYNSEVLACDIDPSNLSPSAKAAIDHCYSFNELDTVLAKSDFIVNCAPLTPDTKNLWNMDNFKKMKNSAVFMNIGRGPSVNEQDLASALHNEAIAGAVLDVFHVEPLVEDNPLWLAPNLLMTPHCGGISMYGLESSFKIFKENVIRYRESGTANLKNIVDVNLGY